MIKPHKLLRKNNSTTEDERNKALIVSRQLNKIILESLDFEDVAQKIADAIPNELAFATGVVAIIDEKKGTIKRVAASRTKEAIEAIKALVVPFKAIEIPISDQSNYMAKAVREHKILITTDSFDVLGPVLTREQAKKIQEIMGAKTTFVCPIYGSKNRAIGVFLASTSKTQEQLTQYEKDMIQIFIDGVGIAIEHALLYSRLRETSEQLAAANLKLKELDKLKDDFVSVASHELRTPMTAIKSYLWMALNKYGALPSNTNTDLHKTKQKLPEDLEKYIGRAYISVERLINLVNDMLNISRIESGRIALRLTECDLIQLAQETIDEVHVKAAEKNLKIKIEVSPVHRVLADRDKVHEVYLNLLGNALKFTPNNGLVTVNFQEKTPFVYVSIVDTGVGIAKEDLNRLFTKFGRLDNSYVASASSGGTGLGLFISKSLVEIHKGTIIATSEGSDKGTTFTFSLPIVGTEIAKKLRAEAPQETAETKELEKTSVNYA